MGFMFFLKKKWDKLGISWDFILTSWDKLGKLLDLFVFHWDFTVICPLVFETAMENHNFS